MRVCQSIEISNITFHFTWSFQNLVDLKWQWQLSYRGLSLWRLYRNHLSPVKIFKRKSRSLSAEVMISPLMLSLYCSYMIIGMICWKDAMCFQILTENGVAITNQNFVFLWNHLYYLLVIKMHNILHPSYTITVQQYCRPSSNDPWPSLSLWCHSNTLDKDNDNVSNTRQTQI